MPDIEIIDFLLSSSIIYRLIALNNPGFKKLLAI